MSEVKKKQAGSGVPDFLRRAVRQGAHPAGSALSKRTLPGLRRLAAGIGVGIAVVLGCVCPRCCWPGLRGVCSSKPASAHRYLIEDPLEAGLHSTRAGDQWLQGCKWAVRSSCADLARRQEAYMHAREAGLPQLPLSVTGRSRAGHHSRRRLSARAGQGHAGEPATCRSLRPASAWRWPQHASAPCCSPARSGSRGHRALRAGRL